MALLIKSGEIVTADSRSRADIYIEDETITAHRRRSRAFRQGTEIIDATGKLVFPGFIDPHVHIHLPFMATFAKDTHATASMAALIGGTTTFIEMVLPLAQRGRARRLPPLEAESGRQHRLRLRLPHGRHALGRRDRSPTREIVADGTASFKIFLAYKNFFGVDDDEMFHTLKLAAELGVIVTAHCENAELVGQLQQTACWPKARPAPSGMSPAALRPSKPKEPPASPPSLSRPAQPATWSICPAHPALRAAVEAKLRGVKLFVESVLPHFLLDKTYAERRAWKA